MPYWVTFVDKNGTMCLKGSYTSLRAKHIADNLDEQNVPNVEVHHTITHNRAKATQIIRERLTNKLGAVAQGNYKHKKSVGVSINEV